MLPVDKMDRSFALLGMIELRLVVILSKAKDLCVLDRDNMGIWGKRATFSKKVALCPQNLRPPATLRNALVCS